MLTQLHLDGGHVHFRREKKQIWEGGFLNQFFDGAVPGKRSVNAAALDFLHAESAGSVSLRIEIDHQGGNLFLGERGRQVDGGGGLAYASFLIGDGENGRRHGVCEIRRPDGV